MKKTPKPIEIPAADVVVGDTVQAGEGDVFVVAGVRRNETTGHVRLFDNTSRLCAELGPLELVEVTR